MSDRAGPHADESDGPPLAGEAEVRELEERALEAEEQLHEFEEHLGSFASQADDLRRMVEETIGDPIYASVAALDSDALARALQQIDAQDRRRLLGELGLHGGKSPDKGVARLALGKLRTSDPRFIRWAALVFGEPTWHEIIRAGLELSHSWGFEPASATSAVRGLTAAPPSLVRLAIAGHWEGSEYIAPAALACLFDDELVLDAWRDERDSLRDACLEASHDLGELLATIESIRETLGEKASIESTIDEYETEDHEQDEFSAQDEPDARIAPVAASGEDLPIESEPSELTADDVASDTEPVLAELQQLLEDAKTRHRDAQEASVRITSALRDGSPPSHADVVAMDEYTACFERLAAQVASHAAVLEVNLPPISSLDEADAALRTIEASQSVRDAGIDLQVIQQLAELPEAHPHAPLYGAARDRALELSELPPASWTGDDRSDAEQLVAIASAQAAAQAGVSPELAAVDFKSEFGGALALAMGGILPIGESVPEVRTSKAALGDNARPAGLDELTDSPTAIEADGAEIVTTVGVAATLKSVDDEQATAHVDAALEPVPREEGGAAEGEEPVDEAAAVLGDLVRERRFGLAYWLALASGATSIEAQMLRAVAFADKIRAPAGECAGAYRQSIEEVDVDEIRSSTFAQRLAITAAVPAAVFSPFSGAAEVLRKVAPALSETSEVVSFFAAVVAAAERGVQIEASFVRRTRDLASLDTELEEVRRRAAAMRVPRKLVFARASDVWRHWIDVTGPLGSLLGVVEANAEDQADAVEKRVLELRDHRHLERLVAETDRALRRRTARAGIEARALQQLINGATDALDVISEWIDLVREREGRRKTEAERAWQQGPLDDLRAAAIGGRERILELADSWSNSADPLASSVGPAAREIFNGLLLLLAEGQPLAGDEPPAHLVLGEELLKAPGVTLSALLEPVDESPDVPAILEAAAITDWSYAFEARERDGDHEATQYIVSLVAQADPELAETLEARRERAIEAERMQVLRLYGEAVRALDAARRLAHINDGEWGRCYSLLESLDVETTLQLGATRQSLGELLDELRARRDDAVASARASFADFDVQDPAVAGRVNRLLDAGDVAAFQELVLSIERGLALPEAEGTPRDLEEFFPAVIEALRNGAPRKEALLAAVDDGSAVGPIDFSTVSRERRADVRAALEGWLALLMNDRTEQEAKLRSILWLLGFDVEDFRFDEPHGRRGRGRSRSTATRSAEMLGRPIGRALVPAFGSAAEGRYRLLLAFQQMTEEALLDRVAQEPGESPILVLNFALMSVDVRHGLIDQIRRQRRRPVCVVDTATFLFAAARGGGLETLMRLTLPFTAVNPYTPFVAGKVPPEMFYGRKHELESVVDPNGTSFIYGGRQLGKSALLRAAEREFSDTAGKRHAIYVDLKNQGIGEWRPAADVHEVLAREFTSHQVVTSRRGTRPPEDLYEEVAAWIDGDPERRVLLLLDEADEFLNADAAEGFRAVRRLKELMDRTERRFKPVLAGLHQVQRFQSIPNQPLAHLGQPIAVGPLTPQYAFNLVSTPLEALGYRFEADEAVFRILTNTNYQPSLIQLFCDELVRYVLKRPVPKGSPPYVVGMDDVERVYGAPDLASQISNRFELTINLDPRYRVIAFVLALRGLEAEMTPAAIREECEAWWPAGFEGTTDDEFAALLDELRGLGILYATAGRYTMRSPNVLRMLGTHEQIEDKLLSASEAQPPQKFHAATFRSPLGDNPYRRSPLTEQQASQLMRPEMAIRVVLGSTATRVGDVPAAIEAIASRAGGHIEVVTVPPDRQRVRRAFTKESRGRHRVVVCCVPDADAQRATDLMTLAADLALQPRESTSSIVFVVGERNLGLWRAALETGSVLPRIPAVKPVILRRWTASGLTAWSHGQDVDLPFMDEPSVARALAATGGWPVLVDKLVSEYVENHRLDSAIEAIHALIASSEGATNFLAETGLTGDQAVLDSWLQLAEYGESVSREDLLALLGDVTSPGSSLELLHAIQALRVEADGRMSPEPVLHRAWAHASLARD